MKILIDVSHLADFNFLKIAINQLHSEGHQLLITVLKRGELPAIARNELKDFPIVFVGKHSGTKWSIIFEANILKFFQLFCICLKFRPDIGLSTGSFILGAILKLQGKPNIQFDDDPERKVNLLLEKLTATRLYFPIFFEKTNKNVGKYKALKEWSFLSPNYFSANQKILNDYGLLPKTYIFIREVSNGSLNYSNQNNNIIATVAHLFPANIKVILSLENKATINSYPVDWILLEEPVKNIHSLMYYSALVISSGDSMAREGAVLGVPSIYCGIRDMGANRTMINLHMLFKVAPSEVPEFVKVIFKGELNTNNQEVFRQKLLNEWDDVNEFIKNSIGIVF